MNQNQPISIREILVMVERLAKAGQRAEAIGLLEGILPQLPTASPADLKLRQALATLLLASKRDVEAEPHLRLLCEADRRTSGPPMLMAALLRRTQRGPEALRWAEETIRRQPGHPEAHKLVQQLWRAGLRSESPPSVGIIIATTGDPLLGQALRSALEQDWPSVEVWVVTDGPAHQAAVDEQLAPWVDHPRLRRLCLPQNTGADGFNGHRIYGSVPWLLDTRYVAFLDQDNWFEPDHIGRMMELLISRGMDWAFALRRLVGEEGQFLGYDDCESLGSWPSMLADNPIHLVDFNCYLIRRDIAVQLSSLLLRRFGDGWCPDFALCATLLRNHPDTGTPGLYSVNYRIGRTQLSASLPDFQAGNARAAERYPQGFPWRAPT
jgi:hypothetical protein